MLLSLLVSVAFSNNGLQWIEYALYTSFHSQCFVEHFKHQHWSFCFFHHFIHLCLWFYAKMLVSFEQYPIYICVTLVNRIKCTSNIRLFTCTLSFSKIRDWKMKKNAKFGTNMDRFRFPHRIFIHPEAFWWNTFNVKIMILIQQHKTGKWKTELQWEKKRTFHWKWMKIDI